MERCVERFPNAGRYWRQYIDAELRQRNFEKVEKLFQRCLLKVLNIDLWRAYLNYVKDTKGSLPSYREKMAQAYDFALDKMGMDIMSYQIWADYITFLKNVEAVGSYAENQRITAVRKIYQRGCVNPMVNIEQLWKDYTAYETGINPLIAKKMVDDRSRDYMNARRVSKEYEAVTRGLARGVPSVPPMAVPEEERQVALWKKYIAWEKGNPLRSEDHAAITKRVMFAYEQCLLCLGHHPDIWYEAALYLEQSSKLLVEKGDTNAGKLFSDEAANMYERAITTMLRRNQLLYFAYADFEESRMHFQKVHQIYQKILDISDADPSLAYIQYMKFARRAEGIKSARAIFKKAREDARSSYHIFVGAALMEYYCSKDKNVAFKIFELGVKRYADSPEFILSYVEHLSHLNEDNNTRVLFERVLTSGGLRDENSLEIWNEFLRFETDVGDLASILKVERRRNAVIERLSALEGKETALLVDRYKFLDLYPCTGGELRAIGYRELSRPRPHAAATTASTPATAAGGAGEDDDGGRARPEYPRPNLEQMIPFKPRVIAPPGAHPVPGGVFPAPPAAAHLMGALPPPAYFHGPFVAVDCLIERFRACDLPTEPLIGGADGANGHNALHAEYTKLFEFFANTGALPQPEGRKRKAGAGAGGEGDDDDEDDAAAAPPVNDLYRARQQKRVR
ncbi:PREDICTED: cleavage stimulation factor subunit 3-like [Priapulus caudatus]|uniref:Cleavage stimulation factor subunit 3-like n=1 Tax=Priapulus caudatus TaxID=37621 RepID=A0ABM1DYK8_PRICU|nr:PREDICTED: cleavage stimulation factor subunit 3-like [Priapulus caudatus]